MAGALGRQFGPAPACSLRESRDARVVRLQLGWRTRAGTTACSPLGAPASSGGKVIIVDPWLNQTAQAVWPTSGCPSCPAATRRCLIGHAATSGPPGRHSTRQDYLDKYCVGFDAGPHARRRRPEGNFKDYLLGTYDGEPKTPEWAEKICGVPAADIVALAEEIIACDDGQLLRRPVHLEDSRRRTVRPGVLHHGPHAWRHRHAGPLTWAGRAWARATSARSPQVAAAVQNVPNPLNPPGYPVYTLYPIPNFMTLEDPNAWVLLEPSESWTNILEGEYGRDCWPTGKHKIDVHHMYYGVVQNSLNQIPNTNAGIEATRKMDFVLGHACSSTPRASTATSWSR